MRLPPPGEDLQVDAVFIYENSVSPSTLHEGLASDGRHVIVSRHMEIDVPGVFASCASAGNEQRSPPGHGVRARGDRRQC
jgi:thioredoxin reductase